VIMEVIVAFKRKTVNDDLQRVLQKKWVNMAFTSCSGKADYKGLSEEEKVKCPSAIEGEQ
jgi:hypothetical protein